MTREIIQEMHKQKISGGYVVLLRISLGLAFLTTWVSNLVKGVFTSSGFVSTISWFLDHEDHVITPFDTIIRNVAFPNASLFGFGWFIMEFFISITLLLGVLTRLGSIFGAGSTVILGLGTLGVEWLWTQPILFIGFVTCALIGAGRWYGIDFWLKDKVPSRIANVLV
ncbi:MAG: hypothetical protein ACFFAU_13810 [Candidatus Hodarchaeota archaeon]